MKYDFHVLPPQEAVGLTLETRDTFGNRSTVEYDTYRFLPEKTRQWLNATDYLESSAEYDYRTFQVRRMTDPNDNISVFDYSPLGLLRATALIGKGTEGDYKSGTGTFYERYAPSVRMEYDFFAFQNEGNPVWVKTIQREQHYQQNPDSETIVKVEYSDGFGRLLQTRAQAEDVIFGNRVFGSSGLPADQTVPNSPAVGTERNPNDPLNVTVSGWQVYNNKGAVVEQYEPFFDQGFDYALPQNLGVNVKMYYDPRGQAVRTLNPDKTEQWVIFGVPPDLAKPDVFAPTPWESYTYDANDLAPLTHPTGGNVSSSHYYTPKSTLLDALGRSIKTTEHIDKANTPPVDDIVMRYRYDIRGNLMEVKDPYGRTVFEYVYDFRAPEEDENGEKQPLPPLKTKHIDSGIKRTLYNGMGQPIEMTDSKGSRILNAYDGGLRNIRLWARDNTGENITLRQILIYGDNGGLMNPKNTNHNGKLYKHYDGAGLLTIGGYDFKGNALKNIRQCISDAELLSIFTGSPVDWAISCYRVDWTSLPSILDAKEFETDTEYDALNRIVKVTYPEDMDNERKMGIPTYNRAGKLERLTFDGTDYVKHIAYNAKSQRIMIAYGNTVMTRYVYDKRNFRLLRLKSEKYTQAGLDFTPVSGTKQDYGYKYDLSGNIITINDRTPECGVGGTDSLDRQFTYDPLYRLLTADGRETATAETYPWDETRRPHDASISVAYDQGYSYDKLGNILELIHHGDTNFIREFIYISGTNKLGAIDVASDTYNYTYDENGNQTGETDSRHFEWDFGDNMRCFYIQAGTSEPTVYGLYLYGASGNRVKKLVRTSGGNYESVSYADGLYEYKTDGTDEQATLQLMDDRVRIATVRIGDDFGDTSPAIKYNLDDHLGSSVLELNVYGSMKRREEYYPFGETSFGSYAKKRYRFCGKEKDSESGLYYYGMRYYAPWMCRFVSVDPLAAKYSFYTPYQYAGNKPINFIDLDGGEEKEGRFSLYAWDSGKRGLYAQGITSSFDRKGEASVDYLISWVPASWLYALTKDMIKMSEATNQKEKDAAAAKLTQDIVTTIGGEAFNQVEKLSNNKVEKHIVKYGAKNIFKAFDVLSLYKELTTSTLPEIVDELTVQFAREKIKAQGGGGSGYIYTNGAF